MSYYCKYCGRQSLNEPFGLETCDECWDKKTGHKELNDIEELPTERYQELKKLLQNDILERYDSEEYYNPDIIHDFLQEAGYKLK